MPIFSIVTVTAPLVAILLTILLFIVFLWIRGEKCRECKPVVLPKIKIRSLLAYSSIILLVIGVLLGEYRCGVIALLLEIIVLLIIDRRVFKGVDYGLIIVFLLIFPLFKELSIIITSYYRVSLHGLTLYLLSIVLSQLISNVPATIALISYTSDWKTLLIGVNIAGYLSPIGSLANMIGLRISGMKFSEYFKYTIVYNLIVLFIGIFITLLL